LGWAISFFLTDNVAGPGRFISDDFLFVAIASILAMFRITKAKDNEDREIPVEKKFTTGVSV
jgi:hypothetical protein